ncbi:MAG: DinB family protein [Chloroflexota bacterium]
MNAMGYSVGVEDIEPGHWVAYVLALPGCFNTADSEEHAVSGAPKAVQDWFYWMYAHTGMADMADDFSAESYAIGNVESFYAHPAAEDPEYLVNAFFEEDARPLLFSELLDGLELMEYTRADMLSLVNGFSPKVLNTPIPGDTRFGSIAGILKHVAVVEWWYCERMGLVDFDWSSLPEDPLQALEVVRANTVSRLPDLTDDPRVNELVGERWSARKVLRRALWHERDHTEHIRKLLKANS